MRVAVGFGSNLGDRRRHLTSGLDHLSRRWRPVAVSSIYESDPVGPVEQARFLNAVAVFEAGDPPEGVLGQLLAAEQARGRTREVRWGPRTLDLDLLLYGSQIIELPGLTIPHPGLVDRRFALEPLLEAWPAATLPDGTSLAAFLPSVADQAVRRLGPWGVRRWRTLLWRAQRLLGRENR